MNYHLVLWVSWMCALGHQMSTLKYRGAAHFRTRIICATLSGRPLVSTSTLTTDYIPNAAAGVSTVAGGLLVLCSSGAGAACPCSNSCISSLDPENTPTF